MPRDLKLLLYLAEKLPLYIHNEIDVDYSLYPVKNADVYSYKWHDTQLNDIFKRFQARCDGGLYIIGNYLYFTLNGAKYYVSLCSFESEEWYLADLIKEIEPLVCDIAYERGRLD